MAAFLSTVLFKTIVVIRGLLTGSSVRSVSVSLALFRWNACLNSSAFASHFLLISVSLFSQFLRIVFSAGDALDLVMSVKLACSSAMQPLVCSIMFA